MGFGFRGTGLLQGLELKHSWSGLKAVRKSGEVQNGKKKDNDDVNSNIASMFPVFCMWPFILTMTTVMCVIEFRVYRVCGEDDVGG